MLAASIILLTVGLALLVRGLAGRRVGSEPHCRKCKYELTNLTSDRCPECGVILAERPPVIGVRRRRGKLIALGLFLVLLASGGLVRTSVPVLRTVNWYCFAPFSWVLSGAENDVPDALTELRSRRARRTLSTDQVLRLADAALRIEVKTPIDPNWRFWMSVLDDPALPDLLAPEGRGRYMANLQQFEIVAPKKRRQGEGLPVQIRYDRSPLRQRAAFNNPARHAEPWDYSIDDYEVVVHSVEADGMSVGESLQESRPGFGGSFRSVSEGPIGPPFQFRTDSLAVGQHRVTATLNRRIARGFLSPNAAPGSPWTSTIQLETSVDIDPPDAPPSILSVTDDETSTTLRSRIDLVRGGPEARGNSTLRYWRLEITFPLPCGVAGEFYLVSETDECRIASVTKPAAPRMNPWIQRQRWELSSACAAFADSGRDFTLVLRSRPQLALYDPEIDKVWATDLEIARYSWPDNAATQPAAKSIAPTATD